MVSGKTTNARCQNHVDAEQGRHEMVEAIERTKNEYAIRVEDPRDFDKKSFKTTMIPAKSGKVNIITGCPKGKWNKKTKRCSVGMPTQTYRLSTDDFSRVDAERWTKRNICPKHPNAKACKITSRR